MFPIGYKWQELVENCKLASLSTAHYYMKSRETMPENKVVAMGECVASTDGERE